MVVAIGGLCGALVSYLTAGALLFIGGAASLRWTYRRRGEASVAIGGPLLAASLDYQTR